MEVTELLALFDREQRREVEYFGLRRETGPHVIRQVPLAGQPGDGCVIWSDLAGEDVDTTIDHEVAYYQSLGHGFEWKVFAHDVPPDLAARLAARDLELEEPEAVLVLDLDSAAEALWQPVRHDVRRLVDPESLADVMAVQAQVWGGSFDWLTETLAAEMAGAGDRISVYVAYDDGRPVSSARIRFHPEGTGSFASLWGGSTLSAYRGRGYYTALLAIRAREARAKAARFLTVDASPMSRPILEKHGFRLITYAQACRWRSSPSEPI
jgi:GNAT superfamily N-acetyltransferase